MIAGIFPALKLLNASSTDTASNSTTAFKRGIMLSRVVAGAGGVALIFGIILYYYIYFVDKAYATSASGIPFVGAGAAFGVVAFILSTYQSPKLRKAYKAGIMKASSSNQSSSQPSKMNLPSRTMIIVTPIILVVALVLMVVGSSI
jgi:hypothetical protein